MIPRCLVFCTLILTPSPAVFAQSPANVRHIGRNIVVAPEQTVHNARCFLCSAEVQGHATGSVRVFAGNLTLTNRATVGGHVLIFGGHLHQDSATMEPPPTVFAPIIFLPIILAICAAIGGLITLTRRMVRGPIAYPPLPRL